MEDIGLEEKLARVQKLLDATSNDFSRICKELTDCEKERDQLREQLKTSRRDALEEVAKRWVDEYGDYELVNVDRAHDWLRALAGRQGK